MWRVTDHRQVYCCSWGRVWSEPHTSQPHLGNAAHRYVAGDPRDVCRARLSIAVWHHESDRQRAGPAERGVRSLALHTGCERLLQHLVLPRSRSSATTLPSRAHLGGPFLATLPDVCKTQARATGLLVPEVHMCMDFMYHISSSSDSQSMSMSASFASRFSCASPVSSSKYSGCCRASATKSNPRVRYSLRTMSEHAVHPLKG